MNGIFNRRKFFFIVLGTFFIAVGTNMFLLRAHLSTGGISGVGTVLFYLFNIPLSVTNIVLNGILFLFGYKLLGKSALFKTSVGIVFLSLFLEITNSFPGFSNDIFISAVVGGALTGIGVGMVLRVGASTGGSDFAAVIAKKFFPYLSVATIIFFIDIIIICISSVVFKSFDIAFYSVISMYISAKATEAASIIGNTAKCVEIISDKYEMISDAIIKNLNLGVTGIYKKGMYRDNDGLMLMCVVYPKQLPYFIHTVRSIDKNAFCVITDVREVLGEGFKIESEYDNIHMKK